MTEETYLYDDFFADSYAQVTVKIRGRDVPINLKRGVSWKDFQEAKEQATKMRFKPNGQPEIYSYSDGIFGVELLIRCIKSWPFTFPDGKAVPVTRETISALVGDGVSALVAQLQNVAQQGVEALAPFEKDSVDHSSATEA